MFFPQEMAETFLVRCLNQKTFDDMCLAAFSSNALKMDFEKTPCTSANERNHIHQAYY